MPLHLATDLSGRMYRDSPGDNPPPDSTRAQRCRPGRLMVRRLGIGGLDAFQFHGFQHAGLALHLFFQELDEFALIGQHFIQLLDLVFEVGDMRFKLFHPLVHCI